jgi:hypothetical protein
MALQTATNPNTGETVALVGNQWLPVTRTASNDQGQKAYLVNNQWLVDQEEEKKKAAGFSLKDLALSFGQGVGGGAQALTDVAGAGNVVSKGLTGLQQAAGEAMTPERQAEILRRQEIKKKAEGNTLEEIKAVLGGFAEAPLQTLAQGAGSIVPMVLGTALMPAAAVPAAVARLTAMGVSAGTAAKVASSLPAATVGAMMGVGGQKGQDYETVKRELLEKKIPEEEAERLAQKAAEYSLQNVPRQLASGAAGALAGGLGVESLVGRIGKKLPEVKGPSLKLPEPTVAQAIGKSTAAEALPEALQSAVSTVGTNVALNQAGVERDLTQGVLANAINDALVGGILGAGASPLKLKEMRQQYVEDEFKGQQEYQKQQQEEIAANQKKIKDELSMTQNPLGMLTVDDLGADLFKVVQQNRADTGKPALTSFSLDDVVDALPDKDKESLNAIIAAKTGYTNEVYTPAQVIEAAQAKNVETGTQGFSDFLSRTTGLSDPSQMSQPQLHAAITSLAKLPGFTSTQSLPEGLNATNYTPEQFTKAIDGLNAKMDELGKDDLSFKETTKAIETATGLKGSAVNALLNDANRSGDIVTDNKKVSVPSRTTPTGYGISEEVGAEQEQATSYEVRRGDEILDEHTTKESADQQVEGLNKLTAEEIKNIDESLKTEETKINKAEKEVQRLILAGNRNTPEFKAAQDAYQQVTDESFPRIAELKARKESYQTPLTVAPIGVKKVKPKSYVVRKGQGIQTVKQTREEAEQAIFEDLADTDLQELAKKRSPALQKRVNAEIQRRATLPAKPAPAAEATATTPEQQAKLDQLKQDLPAMLKKFGLGDVGLKIVNAIEGGADGSYEAKLIQIALGAEKPIETMRHEAIHALKELGFFTPQQWAALERQAKKEWVKKYLEDVPFETTDGKTISRYEAYKTPGIASKEGLNEEQIIEEAIADAFGDWDSSKAPGGMLTALLNKMRNFFSALRSYLNGEGFQTYKDVFGKIEKGELKAKAPAAVSGEAKMALKTEKYGMLNPAIQPKYEKVLNDIIDEMEVTPEELASTSLLYQTGKAGIEQFEGPDIGRLPAVVQHLQDLRRQSGLPLLDTEKPEDRKTLARLMTIEAMAAIRSGGANLEWYDSVINKTLGMAGLKYAELNTDSNARSAFRVGMAVTSQGLNVEDNLAFAMKVYDSFRLNQRFPEIGQGADQGAMVSNFKLANALLTDMGPDLMRQFLETEFTVDEMRSAGFDIKGELKDEKVLGSSVFGPKIGFGFYSNLNGNFEPTTMDMWFMRTIGRLTGNLKDFDPELYKEQLGKFRNALNVKGDNGVFANQFNEADVEAAKTDDDAAETLARKVKSAHERDYKNNRADYNNKTREKSKLVGAAESMINSLDKPRDAPASGSERRNLRDVVRQMVDMVEKKYGKRVPPASLQAAIWYPEQELYKALGVRLRVTSQSYAGAMEKILTKEGYNAGQLSTAAKSGSRTTQRLANAPVAKRTQATGTQPYKVGPLETKQREEFLEKYRTKTVIEQERETPRRKKVVFEVAPDPNNVDLTNRWRSLDQATRLNISEKIARSIVRKAMADFDVDGYIAPQVGSYMDDTNPSFALFLNAGDSVEISKFIGYALSQDSMMVISPKPAKGLDKVSAITVDLNTQDPARIDKVYQELRKIKVDGETPIGGQTTMNGKMILLNYSNVESNELASLIDNQLNGDYNISVGDVYSAFPEKESYNYANPSDDPRGERGIVRERSRSLRDEATRQLQAELGEPTSQRGRRAKLSLRKAPDTPAFKQFFGNSVVVNADGTPKVMYHGTARDITAFKPRQAGAIFLTENPEFAGEYADVSAENKALERDLSDYSAQELEKAKTQAIKDVRASYGNNKESANLIREIRSDSQQGEALDFLKLAADNLFPEAGPNIMPVYVRSERPFDYENPDHIAALGLNNVDKEDLANNVARLESDRVQNAIRAAGFDGFYIKQGNQKNLAVYDLVQIKSATGNIGTFDTTSPDIRYSLSKVKNEVDSLPNGAAINASINRLAPGREQKGYIERILDAFKPQSVDALRQQFLNRYNQLGVYDKEVAKQMGGAALLADSSAESAALMSDNAAAIASMACGIEGKGGIPVFDKGYTTISNANGEKGVLEILMPLAKIGDPRIYQTYQFWAGSLRGSRLLANGTDHTYTKAEIDYAKELLVKYPEFKQVQEDWIKYNNGLMKYAVETGVLSPEKAAEFMKYSDYIPFYRQIDGEKTVGPRLFQNISGVTPPKQLKGLKEGQDVPFADFLETIVRNTQSIIQSGMKNTAAQRAIGQAVFLKMADKRQDVSYAPGVVTVLENGKPVSYDVADQLFIDAVKSLNMPELPFLSFFAAPANLLRNLVTKDPGFMMANLMRDSLSAWVTSGAKMTPIASTIANFGRAIGGTDPVYLALRNAGVIGGYEFAAGVENSGIILGESLRRATGTQTGTEKALKPFTSLWRGLEKGTEASDAATRMAVYKATLEKTGNEAEAIYRAMEVMNFNRKGNLAIVRILTAAVPFLNARMQGLDVFYRAAFGKMATEDAAAIQKSFFIRGATLMALTSMYWFLTHEDEEYLAQEQETRDNNWLFPSAGIRIPIPFEVGVLFKVVPERILEYSFGSDTGKDMADSFKRNLISTFAFNPIPQTVLPLVEARTNYSFFTMRPIVGQGMENVAKEYQTAPNTSEAAKKLGGILGESPIIVDHIMKGYTGSLGMYAIDLIDAVLFSNDASPKPAKRFEQMPVIKRFIVDKEAKGTVTAYYELKNSVDEVVRTINLMERTSNVEDMGDYIEKNANLLGMRGYISSVEKQMKMLREAAIQIRSSDMSPEEKRESLSAITEAQNAMTANIREIKKSIQQ